MTRYPERELGDALDLDLDRVDVVATSSYQLAGVYSFGRGLFAREQLRGSDTSYSALNRLHEGSFVMSRLKAFEGAIGVIPPQFDGYHLSQEFPTFRVKDGTDPRFVHYLTKWPEFWRRLADTSKGLGSRRERVHPESLLSIRAPLPALAEQQRVSAKLDRLMDRVESVDQLTRHRNQHIEALKRAILWSAFGGLKRKFGDVAITDAAEINPETVVPDRDIQEDTFLYIDISAVENGSGRILHPKQMPVASAPSRARRRIRAGDTLLSTVRPNLRAFALVPPELDGQVASTGFAVLRPRAGTVPEFLWHQTHSDQFLQQLIDRSRGHYPAVSVRRLKRTRLTLPDTIEQARVVSVLEREAAAVDSLGHLTRDDTTRVESFATSILNQAFNGDL